MAGMFVLLIELLCVTWLISVDILWPTYHLLYLILPECCEPTVYYVEEPHCNGLLWPKISDLERYVDVIVSIDTY